MMTSTYRFAGKPLGPVTGASRPRTGVIFVALLSIALIAPCVLGSEQTDWIAKSDENTRILLELQSRFSPEGAGRIGVDGFDEEIFQLPLDRTRQVLDANSAALRTLRGSLDVETDPRVRQDLQILIDSVERNIRSIELNEKYELPYFNLPQGIFQGIQALLDDQIPANRRSAALVRLRKYAGMEEGYTPIAEQARAFISAKLDDETLRGPFRDNLERDLMNTERFLAGIAQLFDAYGIEGWKEPHAALVSQLDGYNVFLREEVMPRAATDFRIPDEQYLHALVQFGVDIPLDELVSRAKVSFREIQNEMQAIAALVARERNLPSADYRDVIRVLKTEQFEGEAILPAYQARIEELEELATKAGIVSIPERKMRIRLASEAESAAIPAPHMRPPRLIGNTGEMGEFVLPLRIPSGDEADLGFDDFTFDAAAWTLAVHEGRPGHEMQFAAVVESGVSTARALYAFNSTNVEGWALYMEAEMKPLMPLEGQLVSLQHRLLRAARAFLDPGLQGGVITREEAFRVLEHDVVVSRAAATSEVERYTFRAPGQATSYFCGYTRLMELRADVERILGDRFDRKAFHDFVLAQGLLPPALIRSAVMQGFVKQE